MKSLLLSAMAAMGVAHGGAFLNVWELPYVEDHFTAADLGRKLNNVFKWDETNDALRDARAEAREETFALYDAPEGPRTTIKEIRTAAPSKSSSRVSR